VIPTVDQSDTRAGPALHYQNALQVGIVTQTQGTSAWLIIATSSERRLADLADDLRWQASLSDPDSLAMLEEMAAAALAEDAAGLTHDLDELL